MEQSGGSLGFFVLTNSALQLAENFHVTAKARRACGQVFTDGSMQFRLRVL
jgi:hypothetical protein